MIQFIKRISRLLSLKWKVLSIVVLTVLFMAAGCIFIALQTIVHSNEEMLNKTLGASLSYSADTLSRSLVSAETVANLLYSDNVIQTQLGIIHETNSSSIRSSARSQLSTVLLRYVEQYQGLHVKYITIDAGSFLYSTNPYLYEQDSEYVRNILYPQADIIEGALVIQADSEKGSRLYMTRIARQIKDFSLENLGYITLCLDLNGLVEDAVRFIGSMDPAWFVLYHGEDCLYSSSGLDRKIISHLPSAIKGSYGVIRSEGKAYFGVGGSLKPYLRNTRKDYDWDYYCLISYEGYLAQTRRTNFLFISLSIILVVIMCLFAGRLFTPIVWHLRHLIDRMRDFDGSKGLIPEPDYQKRHDEIGQLHGQFENMGVKIRNLIEENYEKELAAKQAQLKALEMQVNPHFLYNVLESINWRAQSAGLTEISKMVDALGKLMRGTVSNTQQIITLEEEFTLVSNYITIQKLRFEDTLDFHQNIESGLLQSLVPRLIIQPLVDNAIRYGMADMSEDVCTVEVNIYKKGSDLLCIEVKNTGSFFEENLLEKLENNIIQPTGSGIGLLNIKKRIHLLYGSNCQLTLNNEDGFAVARIIIPLETSLVQEESHA